MEHDWIGEKYKVRAQIFERQEGRKTVRRQKGKDKKWCSSTRLCG